MRIAYLDCFSGVSGDMFLGALVDAGVPARLLEKTVAALNLGARLEVHRVKRGGISALKVDVYVNGEKDMPREQYWERQDKVHSGFANGGKPSQAAQVDHRQPANILQHNYALQTATVRGVAATPHAHFHEHEHDERHRDQPGHGEHHHARHGRGLAQIREIIGKATITEAAKKTAIAAFEALGAAEAKIHDTDIESIHFHEVGAVDAIVDIVCAAVGAESLGADEFICSALNVGGGTVQCAHGTFPVPAPATLELLKDAPVYSSGVQAELVTPTGAAIVKTLAKRFAPFPEMKIEKNGYGAGSRDFAGQANVVRLTLGKTQPEIATGVRQETITVLEANLDDLNPQVFGYVMEQLLEEGALDVFGLPVQMKKNRPGMLLTVLCQPKDASKLKHLMFLETTTLGVREREEKRQILKREWITVPTPWGDVRMKIANLDGVVTNCAPEYEDCRRIAAEHHVPLKQVMQEAQRAYLAGDTRRRFR